MEFYVAGWQENNPLMAFVCFCIAMEGIVSSDEQLTFRFRRNLAVLIGESAFFSKIILKNAKNLYDMRSKIVHSALDRNT